MDPLDYLAVRFHYDGRFVRYGGKLYYLGGSEGMCHIEREKVSLLELTGHLKDLIKSTSRLFKETDEFYLRWLFSGKELEDGFMLLVEDSSCLQMSNAITDGGVADVYSELAIPDGIENAEPKGTKGEEREEGSDREDENQDELREAEDDHDLVPDEDGIIDIAVKEGPRYDCDKALQPVSVNVITVDAVVKPKRNKTEKMKPPIVWRTRS